MSWVGIDPKRGSVYNSICKPKANYCYRRVKEPRKLGHEDGGSFVPRFPAFPPPSLPHPVSKLLQLFIPSARTKAGPVYVSSEALLYWDVLDASNTWMWRSWRRLTEFLCHRKTWEMRGLSGMEADLLPLTPTPTSKVWAWFSRLTRRQNIFRKHALQT